MFVCALLVVILPVSCNCAGRPVRPWLRSSQKNFWSKGACI